MLPGHLVDVLLPVRDGARYVAESIRSLQSQSFLSWRLLVLDDGSSDRTASIVEAMAQEDPRLSLVRLPAAGLVTTLNTGLRQAVAPLVARQDADDISLPHRLAHQVRYLQDHPRCAAVSGGIRQIDEDGRKRSARKFSPPGPGREDPFWIPSRAPSILGNFLLARREALLSVEGYRHFFHAEDVDLCWRLSEGEEIVSSPEIVGHYRIHGASVSTHSTINARLQNLSANLAAVAARRRRAGRGDFDIHPQMHERLMRAESLEGMANLFRSELDGDELHYVLCASIMGLFQTFLFRPLELELSDVRLAAKAWHNLPVRRPDNHTHLAVAMGRVVRKLRSSGRHDLARELAPDGSRLLHHLDAAHRGGSPETSSCEARTGALGASS